MGTLRATIALVSGFDTLTGKIAVYAADHVDTDRIIPARFLSMVTRQGYGELLFADIRDASFPLDLPDAKGATILVVGTNFGSGSSREHAVWAIQQAGFRAVIARREAESPGYSDIFRQNAANCGLLLVELSAEDHAPFVAAGSGADVTVDLPHQTVTLGGHSYPFDIAPALKEQIAAGLDLIGTTMTYEPAIADFERRTTTFVPPRHGS